MDFSGRFHAAAILSKGLHCRLTRPHFMRITVGLKIYVQFLGAFSKLPKATINFVMSVFMEQLSSNWMEFHEVWNLSIFRKFAKKIQVLWKSDKNNKQVIYKNTNAYL
jgi:hypothetical protein